MTDEPMDLTPLDPTGDPPRFERLVRRIVADAMAARDRRPDSAIPLLLLVRWQRPVLAAAATIALVAAGSLRLHRGPAVAPAPVEALGIPTQVAVWAEQNRSPDLDELFAVVANAAIERSREKGEPE